MLSERLIQSKSFYATSPVICRVCYQPDLESNENNWVYQDIGITKCLDKHN